MDISPIQPARPMLPVAREAFGDMAVGDLREIRGEPRERHRMRIYAHRCGYETGRVFRTRTRDGVLIVQRIA